MKFIKALPLLLLFMVSCNKSIDHDHIQKIGTDLTNGIYENNAGIEFVEKGLVEKMMELQADSSAYSYEVMDGDDVSLFTFPKADCRLVIHSNKHQVVIRLRWKKSIEKYQVLGYES